VKPLWDNPELVRNARIQLRSGRMVAAIVICAGISITAWVSIVNNANSVSVDALRGPAAMFALMLYFQITVLLIGGGVYCLQSIHGEKELNTFDYQRVTRLAALELAMGKLFGAPILAYFVTLCLLPAALLGAILGHLPLWEVLQAYVVVFLGCIAFHALALLISLVQGRSSNAVSILLFLVTVLLTSIDFSDSWEIHTLSPYYAGDLIGGDRLRLIAKGGHFWNDFFLGTCVSHMAVLIALYVTFTAWFLFALCRNLKRDPATYELLPPTAALGFALNLNLIVLGFLPWISVSPNLRNNVGEISAANVIQPFLALSAWTFVALALVLLRNRERVRERTARLGSGAAGWWSALWPAPYLVLTVGLVAGGILGLIQHFHRPLDYLDWPLAIYTVAFVGVWLARDALYVQWMCLRRTRHALASALLYLIVFYACSWIVFSALHLFDGAKGTATSAAVLPSALFLLNPGYWQQQRTTWIVALVVQGATALLFAWLQRQRLQEFLPGRRTRTVIEEAQPQKA
jgi:hypothetical protein